mgnify:CR=1 FL=1
MGSEVPDDPHARAGSHHLRSSCDGGRACLRGTRVTVSLLLNLLANGMSPEEILEAYPYLEREDIRQALAYAAWLANESVEVLELDAA